MDMSNLKDVEISHGTKSGEYSLAKMLNEATTEIKHRHVLNLYKECKQEVIVYTYGYDEEFNCVATKRKSKYSITDGNADSGNLRSVKDFIDFKSMNISDFINYELYKLFVKGYRVT